MKVCLSTKLEISREKEIKEVLESLFPNLKISIIIKARKYRGQTVKLKKDKKKKEKKKSVKKEKNSRKKRVTRIYGKSKPKRKMISYTAGEWIKDLQYNKYRQEDGIRRVVDYYRDINRYVNN